MQENFSAVVANNSVLNFLDNSESTIHCICTMSFSHAGKIISCRIEQRALGIRTDLTFR